MANNQVYFFMAALVFNMHVSPLVQVYLEARRQEQQKHEQSLKMLSDEVSQIQEVSLLPLSNSGCVTNTPTNTQQSQSLSGP